MSNVKKSCRADSLSPFFTSFRIESTDAEFPDTEDFTDADIEYTAFDEYTFGDPRPDQLTHRQRNETGTKEDADQAKGPWRGWIPNMVDLFPSCPKVSKVPGFPSMASFNTHLTEGIIWPTEASALWQKQLRLKPVEPILSTPYMGISENNSNMVENMLSLAYSCPGETRIPGFPSAKRLEVLEASISTSCPKITKVAGIPSRSLIRDNTPHEEWLKMKRCLFEKQSKNELIFITNTPIQYTDIPINMASIVPTCPETALIPGFPSVSYGKEKSAEVQREPSVEILPSTCPLFSPGPEKTSNRTEASKEQQFDVNESYIDKKDNIEKVLPLLPPVSVEPQALGSSTAPQFQDQMVPNMSELLPSCPMISRIPGFPSKHEFQDFQWVEDQTVILRKSQKDKRADFIDTEKNSEDMRNSVALLQTCPLAARIPGFPSAQQINSQSMHRIRSSCPVLSRIAGCQSIMIPISSDWPVDQTIVSAKQIKNPPVIKDLAIENKTSLERMVALVPCCPSKTSIPGFPSVPEPKMQNMSSSCPKRSNIVGFPSKDKEMQLDWSADINQIWCCETKHRIVFIKDKIYESRDSWKSMYALSPTCPQLAAISGFPSYPKPKVIPSMVNLHPCIPLSSAIIGFPSRDGIQTRPWLFEMKAFWGKTLKTQSDLTQCTFALAYAQMDHRIIKRMFAMAPCCPREAQIPGFPSLPLVKVENFFLRKKPDIENLLHTCPRIALASGFPSVYSVVSDEPSWSILQEPIWVKTEKEPSILISDTVKEICEKMLLILPTCPNESRIPGFPSANKLKKADKHIITDLSLSCPNTSSIPGMPSRKQITQTDTMKPYWHPLWQKPLRTKAAVILSASPKTEDYTNMFSLVPCCSSEAIIPGFPSLAVIGHDFIQANPNPSTSGPTQAQMESETVTPHLITEWDLIVDIKRSGKRAVKVWCA